MYGSLSDVCIDIFSFVNAKKSMNLSLFIIGTNFLNLLLLRMVALPFAVCLASDLSAVITLLKLILYFFINPCPIGVVFIF